LNEEIKVSRKSSFPFMIIPDRIWDMQLTTDELAVFARLTHHANHENHHAWPSRKTLSQAVFPSLSVDRGCRRLHTAVKRLIEVGMIEKSSRHRPDGSQSSNDYLLLPESEWFPPQGVPRPPPSVKSNTPPSVKSNTPPSVKSNTPPVLNLTPLEPDPSQPDPTKNKIREGIKNITKSAFSPDLVTFDPVIEFDEMDIGRVEGDVFDVGSHTSQVSNDSTSALPFTYDPPRTNALDLKSPVKKPSVPKVRTEGAQVWDVYATAYQNKYGHLPVRNAKQNALCAQLVDRLGGSAAAVTEFYLSHKHRFYTESSHALGLLVKDAESLHTQMLRGQQVTATQAIQEDKGSAQDSVMKTVMAKMALKYQGR
jgi:hypothetical protein